MTNCDILIVTVPFTDTDKPLQAPSILKSVVERHNYTAMTRDLNQEFLTCNHKDLDSMKQYFCFSAINDSDKIRIVEDYVKKTAESLFEESNFEFLAISVFTYQCQTFAKLLAQNIRKIKPEVKIIFGGQGLATQGIQSKDSWAKTCLKHGIIDHYIISEGESALIDVLEKGKGKGIDGEQWEQKLDLDDIPYPNYDDYDLNKYEGKKLMITGSRGCVRRCTFCDIHKHWQKFVYRSGQSIADEMISQSEKYNIYDFSFTDSLINGSMKAYRDFISILAEYNNSAKHKLTWGGQFIVRGLNQMTEKDWEMTRDSGAKMLTLGVESGSENVRDHMKKQFSDKDMDEFMLQANKNNVSVLIMVIMGYPTETYEDFLDTLRMFRHYSKYQKVIDGVVLGTTLGILPGTPIAEELSEDIQMNNGENFWVYSKNPTLDFRERIKRRIIAGEELLKMGYKVHAHDKDYKLLHYLWNVYKNKQQQNVIDMNTSNVYEQKYS